MIPGKMLLGIVAGVATGAVLGVLFAPAKGSVTRRRLSRKALALADDVKDKFDESVDALADRYESIKEDAMEWAEKGSNRVDAATAELKHAKH